MLNRVLIADDHFPVRFGLEIIVKEFLGAGTFIDFASDSLEVLAKVSKIPYDLLITDVIMPGIDFLSMMQKSLEYQPDLKILILSINPKEIFAQRYINAGAFGYVAKSGSETEVRKAMEYISLGKKYFGADEIPSESRNKISGNPFDDLSSREFETMALLIRGAGILEVANKLSLKVPTVNTFRIRIFNKLHVKNRVELVNLARKYGLPTEG